MPVRDAVGLRSREDSQDTTSAVAPRGFAGASGGAAGVGPGSPPQRPQACLPPGVL